MTDETEFARRVADAMYAADPAARAWGVTIEEARPHYARAAMTVREDMANSHGVCHGGMIFALADTAFAYASNSDNRATMALSCNIAFAAAVPIGARLTAVAERVVRGGRTGVYDVTVTDAEGKTVALFRGNSYQVRGESVPGLGEQG